MAPFLQPSAVLGGLKDRSEALAVHGDRLYVGTATGNLSVYSLDDESGSEEEGTRTDAHLVETKKLGKRPVEQIGFVKDINSLAVLQDKQVTLYPLPSLSPPTALSKARTAFSFALHSSVQHLSASEDPHRSPQASPKHAPESGEFGAKAAAAAAAIPTVVTLLVVGCQRRAVVYEWRDGEPQEPKEAPLPHSPRTMSFLSPAALTLAYSPTDYAVLSLTDLLASDVALPLAGTASLTGMGALSGLTGYMTLGLGAKARPVAVRMGEGEALIAKDNEGYVVGADGRPSRKDTLGWPAPPEDVAFIKPYILSLLPAGSVPASSPSASAQPAAQTQPPTFIPTAVLQIRSALSLLPTQQIPLPPSSAHSPSDTSAHPNTTVSARLLTPSPAARAPLWLVTTPADRAAAAAEGSTVWRVGMRAWGTQVDELVAAGRYGDALGLLGTLDRSVLSDKDERTARIRALDAVAQFRDGRFDDAINTFLDLDLNPAKVVALYPDAVAGRLAVPRERWVPLFGGPEDVPDAKDGSGDEGEGGGIAEGEGDEHAEREKEKEGRVGELQRAASPSGSFRKFTTGLGAFMPAGPAAAGAGASTGAAPKDDDTASISGRPRHPPRDPFHVSVETLLRYLTSRRPRIGAALEAVHITPAQSHAWPFLSATAPTELFALPNAPLSALTPEQLVRFAQIVDTALFKSYLVTRPGLIGSLCRLPNWCEVEEVEGELRAREKYAELIYLYNGKKMHTQALALLRQLSEKEEDVEDKLRPSISYLQKLGPEHLEQIYESARWMFDVDPRMAFEVFTSEDVELPRDSVADYLENIDPQLCARYLEYIIDERGEQAANFHDRLAELYLRITHSAKKRGDKEEREQAYAKLLQFIDTTEVYSADRLYGLISSEELFEARAILLGRLGRHDQALEIYVYRLGDYAKAEEYCKRIYKPKTSTETVFLTLLRIYLRPTGAASADLLTPALGLISRHSPRLDVLETLQLIPPLVTTQELRAFLVEALRAPIFDTHVIREISKARNDQLARRLMGLETKRVKVTDSRICPNCHKRIGNSVIAVHSPRGEVTHYQCREAFSHKLQETRH